MARKTKEDAEATRDSLLDAALACFHEHGISGTTLSMIASAAGFSRGAIYWHFKNKAEVIEAMALRKRVGFTQRMEWAASPSQTSPLTELRSTFLTAFGELDADPDMRRLMEILIRYELSDEGAAIREMQRRHERLELDMLTRTLARAADLGHLRDGVDVVASSRLLWVMISGVFYCAMVSPDMYEMRRDGEAALDMFLQSIAAKR